MNINIAIPECTGNNCGCTDGINHSQECLAEHYATVDTSALIDEINLLRKRECELTELLRSAHCIAERKGEDVAWERFATSILDAGIGSVTARTYRVLPIDA